ncbi:unnamed protein product [Strongylus vulgaris]|uniref:Carboxylesterase type B domain-containing protein n=1 Tax=Strongylus vulgaris TaxID=40348 RepID=A0A3P7IWN0_STRVU|nr:unnamed protein product [Strongylus vulgaris]
MVYVGDHLQDVINEVVAFYVDRDGEQTFEFYIDRYTEFLSDLLFNVPAVNGIYARRDARWDIYAYVFDLYNDAYGDDDIPKRLRRATHASDVPYILEPTIDILDWKLHDKHKNIKEFFEESFAEFAIEGHPLNHQALWLEISADRTLRYMQIAKEFETKMGFFNGLKQRQIHHTPYQFSVAS